jgi:hypothetical protein
VYIYFSFLGIHRIPLFRSCCLFYLFVSPLWIMKSIITPEMTSDVPYDSAMVLRIRIFSENSIGSSNQDAHLPNSYLIESVAIVLHNRICLSLAGCVLWNWETLRHSSSHRRKSCVSRFDCKATFLCLLKWNKFDAIHFWRKRETFKWLTPSISYNRLQLQELVGCV